MKYEVIKNWMGHEPGAVLEIESEQATDAVEKGFIKDFVEPEVDSDEITKALETKLSEMTKGLQDSINKIKLPEIEVGETAQEKDPADSKNRLKHSSKLFEKMAGELPAIEISH